MATTVIGFSEGDDSWKTSPSYSSSNQWIKVGMRPDGSDGTKYSKVQLSSGKWKISIPIILYTTAGYVDISDFGDSTIYVKIYKYNNGKRGSLIASTSQVISEKVTDMRSITTTKTKPILTISFEVTPDYSTQEIEVYINADFNGMNANYGSDNPLEWVNSSGSHVAWIYNLYKSCYFNVSNLYTAPSNLNLTASNIDLSYALGYKATWTKGSDASYTLSVYDSSNNLLDTVDDVTGSSYSGIITGLEQNKQYTLYAKLTDTKPTTLKSSNSSATTTKINLTGTCTASGTNSILKFTASGPSNVLYFKSLTVNGASYTTGLSSGSVLSTSNTNITVPTPSVDATYTFVYTIGDGTTSSTNDVSCKVTRGPLYTPPSGLSFTTSVTTKTMTITPKWTNGLKTATFKVFDASKALKTSTTTSGTALTVSNLKHGTSFGYYYILSDGTTNIKVGGTSTSGYEALNFKTKTISIDKTITPSNTNHRLISCNYTGKIDNVTDTSVLKYKSLSVLLDGTSTAVSFSNSATLTANSSAANETFNISNLNPNTAYKIVYVITDGYNDVTNETVVSTTYPYVYIYTNGAWHKAIPYIYDKNTNTWKMIEAYKYTSNQFKVCL